MQFWSRQQEPETNLQRSRSKLKYCPATAWPRQPTWTVCIFCNFTTCQLDPWRSATTAVIWPIGQQVRLISKRAAGSSACQPVGGTYHRNEGVYGKYNGCYCKGFTTRRKLTYTLIGIHTERVTITGADDDAPEYRPVRHRLIGASSVNFYYKSVMCRRSCMGAMQHVFFTNHELPELGDIRQGFLQKHYRVFDCRSADGPHYRTSKRLM